MMLERLQNDSYNYIHIQSLMRTGYEILFQTDDSLIMHFMESDVFIAETQSDSLFEFATRLKALKPGLLETTNRDLFALLRKDFTHSYECYQYGPFTEKAPDSALIPLKEKDLALVFSTYGNDDYMRQLFERGRLLGYYRDDSPIGYIAKHIDGTLGALYVAPQFRSMGYGKRITKAATAYFDDPLLYSQVIDDNTASIQMHKSLDLKPAAVKICWAYNRGFSY